MNLRLQIIVAVVIALALLYIIRKIQKHQVDLKYSMIWFAVAIVYLLFDLIPPLQIWVCRLVGISVPQNMLIFLALGLILIIVFSLTAISSSQTERIRRLTQEVGLLQEEIDQMKLEGPLDNNKPADK